MMSRKSLLVVVGALLMSTGIAYAAVPEDHADISGPFETPMDLTNTCLECHEDASTEVMATSHWTWGEIQTVDGQEVKRGKINVINNFWVALDSNYKRCTSCHAGYGWKDKDFDFKDQSRVDCMVCHDTTGGYMKAKNALAGAGMPPGFTGNPEFDKEPYDLVRMAQNAGLSSRENCLNCHALGGGGDAVKHGDIDMSLVKPEQALDVHMADEGNDFSCQECHITDSHAIKGNALLVSPGLNNIVACIDCHDAEPHKNKRINKHTAKIACQTCHIPEFARDRATKMSWDWSKAQSPEGLAKEEKEIKKDGKTVYSYKKGAFVWEKDVVPEYHWYNGKAHAYTLGDKIDPTKETKLNYPMGSKDDTDSKIMPFKAHRGNQPYDVKNDYFLVPKLFPSKPKDPDAYWSMYDWNKASAAGMKAAGLEFGGEVGFAKSVTYWPINHMVAESKKALKCNACHGKTGRMDWKALGYGGDPRRKK